MEKEYTIPELKELFKRTLPRKFFLGGNRKGGFYYYHWQRFEEKLKPFSRILGGILVVIWILAALGASLLSQTSDLFTIILPFWLPLVLMLFGLLSVKMSSINEFGLKNYLIAMALAVQTGMTIGYIVGLMISGNTPSLAAYFVLIAMEMGLILGLYLFHKRILGAGEAHLAAIQLLTLFENSPTYDSLLVDALRILLKGVDDWCMDSLGVRIQNLDALKQGGITQLAEDYSGFRKKIEAFFDENFFKHLKGHRNLKHLSAILQGLKALLNTPAILDKESIGQRLQRNLGSKSTFAIIFSIIISVIPIVLNFI